MGKNLPPHELFTTSIPDYPVWQYRLWTQIQWGQQWFSRVHSWPVLYLLSPPGASICTKSRDSWRRGLPPLPKPPPLNTIWMMMYTIKVMGGGTGDVASIKGRGEYFPPSLLFLRWSALQYMSSREGASCAPPLIFTPPRLRMIH